MSARDLLKRPRIGFGEYAALPLPYVAQANRPGQHEPTMQRACAKFKRCSGCGKKIAPEQMVFIMDERTLTDRTVEIIEPPLHIDCARIAVKMCPHLRQYKRRLLLCYTKSFHVDDSSEGPKIKQFWFRQMIYKIEDARTGELVKQERQTT